MPRHALKVAFLVLVAFVQYELFRGWSSGVGSDSTLATLDSSHSTADLAEMLAANRLGHSGSVGHPQGRSKQVVVGTSFGAHEDVYFSVVDTLERLLPPSNILVYGREPRYDLHRDVLPALGINPSNVYRDTDDLLAGVASGWAGGDDGADASAGADLVVLGTCEIDMANFSDELFKIWLARPHDQKFDLVCIVHNSNDWSWAEAYSADWARVGALRIMPIAAHVSRGVKANLLRMADDAGRFHLGYDLVPVMEHIPIFSIEKLNLNAADSTGDQVRVDLNAPAAALEETFFSLGGDVEDSFKVSARGRKDGRVLRDVALQGNFELARRDYEGVLADLEAELEFDAAFWGYKRSPSGVFYPTSSDAFILHLVGGAGNDADSIVPAALKRVVRIHRQLSYLDFFAFLGRVDLVLPAFTEGGGYAVNQASSTVAMAAQCGVPLLVTPRVRAAYTYLTDDATIVRPQMMREISAVRALRAGEFTPSARPYPHQSERFPAAGGEDEANLALRTQAEEMLDRGWIRGEAGWQRFRQGIRAQNEETMRLLLWG